MTSTLFVLAWWIASPALAQDVTPAEAAAPVDAPAEAGAPVTAPAEAAAPVDAPAEAGAPVTAPAEAGAPVTAPAEAAAAVTAPAEAAAARVGPPAVPWATAENRPTFNEDLPSPTLSLERIPPRTSYDFGLGLSYGTVSYWRDYFDAWIGFGIRGAWGRNVGNSRFGFDVHFVAEGPVGVHSTLALEPHASWDLVTAKGLLLGAGVGPAVLYHFAAGSSEALPGEKAAGLSPSIVARIGWSQGWTRVGRRLFVYLEPKVRYIDPAKNVSFDPNAINYLAALVIGSGRGQ